MREGLPAGAILALVALGALPADAAPQCSVTSGKSGWVLCGPRMQVTVSKATGQVLSLLAGEELLSTPAGVMLVDTLVGKPLPEGSRPTGVRAGSRAGAAVLSFEQAFGGSHRARVTFTLTRDALRWDVAATTSLSPDREGQVEFRLPVVAGMKQAFWAGDSMPRGLASVRGQVTYRRDTFLPSLTLLNRQTDRGVTLAAPFEVPKPGLAFRVEGSGARRHACVSNFALRMGRDRPARASLFVVPHAGDWRPGLAWMLRAYPGYFRPVSRRVRDGEGWYTLGWPGTGEDAIRDLASRGVTWQEFHGHYPFLGHFLPDREEWAMLVDRDDISLARWEAGNPPGMPINSIRNMRERIGLWHKHGVQAYIYYQTFEIWHQYADKYFPQDIARDAEGRPHEAWTCCSLMNPDPASPWGRYTLGQLDRLLPAYPELDGIFLDRDDYWYYDYAHDDGITMQGTRPCSLLGLAQEKAVAEVARRVHPRGMGIWTNIPTSIEVARGIDGIMAESVGPWAEKTQYLGLVRPLICLPYDADPSATEVKLKTCLSGGYFPAVAQAGPGSESRAMEARYAPLFARMKGREWVLDAHALTLPPGIQGNIFRAPNGDYLVPLVSPDASQVASAAATTPFSLDVPIRVLVPDAGSIGHCALLSGDYAGVGELPFTRRGQEIALRVPAHIAGSLVVLSSGPPPGVTRLSSPLLVRGEANRLALRLRGARNARLTTPWAKDVRSVLRAGGPGSHVQDFAVAVPPDAMGGPVSLQVTIGGQTEELGAWVVDPVEIRRAGELYLKQPEGEDMAFTVSNCTERPQSLSLSGAFVEGSGEAVPYPDRLSLAKGQSRTIQVRLAPRSERGRIEVRAALGGRSVAARFPVATIGLFAPDDLFHDDFTSGSLDRWRLSGGPWRVKNGMAVASGASHLAIAGEQTWTDYSFEVATKMLGSRDPAIHWLKSYLFFRVQDPQHFYRFGFHGGTDGDESLQAGRWPMDVACQCSAVRAPGRLVRAQGGVEGSGNPRLRRRPTGAAGERRHLRERRRWPRRAGGRHGQRLPARGGEAPALRNSRQSAAFGS